MTPTLSWLPLDKRLDARLSALKSNSDAETAWQEL